MSRSKRRAIAKMRAICAVRIGVGIGAAADHVGAVLAGLDQQLLGAGIVESGLPAGTRRSAGRCAQA